MPAYWVIAPYEYDRKHPESWEKVWDDDLADGFVSVGFTKLGDVSTLNENQLREAIDRAYGDKPKASRGAIYRMMRLYGSVRPGDRVIARQGLKKLAAVGTVTRAAYYDRNKGLHAKGDNGNYARHLDIRWDLEPRDKSFDSQVFRMPTIYDVTEDKFRQMTDGEPSQPKPNVPVFVPGQLYRRKELHQQFGGQQQGGISTPARTPFVMLITGDSGKQHGYHDQWTDNGFFAYTGEGQRGDMKLTKGNLAIHDHKREGKSLFLFEQDKKDKRFLRFLGNMEYVDHSYREAPDTQGKLRKAIVFRLRPAGVIAPDSAAVAAALTNELPLANQHAGGGFGSVETNRKVERAAIDFVKRHYERDGWNVVSVEVEKVGYDLRCEKAERQEHVEVKGTQSSDICFIITAGEVRNAMIDRDHVTCIVTSALSTTPKMFLYSKEKFISDIELEPIAFRARRR